MKRCLLPVCLCIAVLAAKAQPTAGLVAYWKLNGNYTDSGPFNINGTNVGTTATTNNVGAANSAMAFTNPTSTPVQYATHPVNTNLNFGTAQDFSVDMAFFVNNPIVHYMGLYDYNLNYGGYGVWLWNANGYLQVNLNFKNGNVGSTNGALTTNTWYHVCCVRSAGTLRIYINGVLNASNTEGTATPSYNFTGRFGTMFFAAGAPQEYNPHNGKLDEIRIYNRALTQAEITQLSVIPVKISSFSASYKNNTSSLNWQTSFEQNTSRFNIERSIDGINFSVIGSVPAAGNSNQPRSYIYNDLLPGSLLLQPGVFYRLKAVDLDGKFSYSQVVAVRPGKKDIQLALSPNPARDLLQVQIGQMLKGPGSIQVTDIWGRVQLRKETMLNDGTNTLPLDISKLAQGIYILQLVNGGQTINQRFVKE